MSSEKLQAPGGLLALPRELLDCIFQQFHPAGSVDLSDSFNVRGCARVCRTLYIPAVATLWREQVMDNVCIAVLSEWRYGSPKWPAGDAWGSDVESGEDDEMNRDAAVGDAAGHYDYRYTYDYIPGPIPAEDWQRFQHYAPYIRVLRYSNARTIEPLVFTYLQQRAGDKPVFPNLQELIWMRGTPEMTLMTSPLLKVLRILADDGHSNDNGCQHDEFGFRSRHHALKTMLPSTLARTPVLEVLELPLMGHESFWAPLSQAFRDRQQPLCPHLHTVHITESPRVLTKAALKALSKVKKLAELRIDIVGTNYPLLMNWNVSSITRDFASLERLRLRGSTAGVAALVCAIVAPRLEDLELVAGSRLDDRMPNAIEVLGAALSTAFDKLRERNATTIRRLSLTIHGFDAPVLPRRRAPDLDVTVPAVTRPLSGLRRLEELVLVHSRDNARMCPSSVVAAWPSLRMLSLPEFVLTPDALQDVARTCAALEALSTKCLSPDFLEQLAPLATVRGDAIPALRGLHVYDVLPQMCAADARKIASFLDSLLPQLQAETCSVLIDATHTYQGVHDGGWHDVVRELQSLQSAARGRAHSEKV